MRIPYDPSAVSTKMRRLHHLVTNRTSFPNHTAPPLPPPYFGSYLNIYNEIHTCFTVVNYCNISPLLFLGI